MSLNTSNKKIYLGYLFLSLAQFAVALNFICGKEIAGIVPAYIFICIRFIIGTFLLLSFYYVAKKPLLIVDSIKKVTFKNWCTLAVQGLCGGFIFNFLLIEGLRYTSATSAGMVASTFPAVLSIFSYFILRESINADKYLGMCGA